MTPSAGDPSPTPRDQQLQARLAAAIGSAYAIEGEIGRGGMGIVYRARDLRLKRAIAVKLLPPELAFRDDIRTRFLREAQTAARLSHPNIVPIYAVDERDGFVYFAMGLVEGDSVGDRLRQGGSLPIADARRIVREVAMALAYAHANGVVHRDIKPDNVLLDARSGHAMVTDFGIARAASDDGAVGLTATGVAIGTPAYMSPEQCSGERDVDGRSDLYSLGAVAYQLLAGRPPFVGTTSPSVMMKQVTEAPKPIRSLRPDVPEDLARIVMTLLEKDPADRFPDGATLVGALDGAAVLPVRSAGRGPPPTATAREQRRSHATHPSQASRREMRRAERKHRRESGEMEDDRPLPDRIRSARKRTIGYLSTSLFLVYINAVTGGIAGGFWWCVFPIGGMGLGLIKQLGGLWADGVRMRDILTGSAPLVEASHPAALPAPGPHAPVLQRAHEDRRNVHDLVARLTAAERQVIPEVSPTADALYERIVALASALDRMDAQLDVDRGPALDRRIDEMERRGNASADHDRRLRLLRRQREMLTDLATSRATIAGQMENAALLLQNLSLDVLKVRSSGLDSALGGITSVTQEARVLSREIGYVLSAADELRDLDAGPTAPLGPAKDT